MIILDTNVLSADAHSPSLRVGCEKTIDGTLHDLDYRGRILLGIEMLPQGKRRQGLLRAAEYMLNEDLEGRVLVLRARQRARLPKSLLIGARSASP